MLPRPRIPGTRSGPPGAKAPLPAESSTATSVSSASSSSAVRDRPARRGRAKGSRPDFAAEDEDEDESPSDPGEDEEEDDFVKPRRKTTIRITANGDDNQKVETEGGGGRGNRRKRPKSGVDQSGSDSATASEDDHEFEADDTAIRSFPSNSSRSDRSGRGSSASSSDELAIGSSSRSNSNPIRPPHARTARARIDRQDPADYSGEGSVSTTGKAKAPGGGSGKGTKVARRMEDVGFDDRDEYGDKSSSVLMSEGRGRPRSTRNRKRRKDSSVIDADSDEHDNGPTGPSSSSDHDHDPADAHSNYSHAPTANTSSSSASPIDPLFRHHPNCTKCLRAPAYELYADAERREAARTKKGGPAKRKLAAGGNEDFLEDEMEGAEKLGGWGECTKCAGSYHWSCLPPSKRNELIKYDKLLPPSDRQLPGGILHMDDTIDLQCPRCDEQLSKSCMVCQADRKRKAVVRDADAMVVDVENFADGAVEVKEEVPPPPGILFRCLRCKRAAHYDHLPALDPDDTVAPSDPSSLAERYQSDDSHLAWHCADCRNWIWKIEIIIAWRPAPPTAKEPKRNPDEIPNAKALLPREYLVKWQGRGFRHVRWLPHDWMALMETAKLLSFLRTGSRLSLDTEADLSKKKAEGGEEDALQAMMEVTADDERRGTDEDAMGEGQPKADAGALDNIPTSWSTVDRVLGVWVLTSTPPAGRNRGKGKGRAGSEEVTLRDGIKPPDSDICTLEEWQARHQVKLGPADVDEVARMTVWAYIKWQDLQYNSCCYDTPPPRDSSLWSSFHRALVGFLRAREVMIPTLSEKQARARDKRIGVVPYQRLTEQPACVVGGTLMHFQLEGLNWLLHKWHQRESCILADDMGLGKTVQIASLLGLLGSDTYHIYPFLVVVPNSTLQTWIREFEKWAPHLRVVPYYGVGDSRTIIKEWELYHHKGTASASGLKAHVVVTSYEGITMRNDFSVLSKIPRWEMLIVDEAQRLKSDKTLIYKRLGEMKVAHKVLLTGTPLNNTVREIMNLLHFLDPAAWQDLDGLEKKYAEPDEALFKELREMIAPYMLRRRKDDVLDLPAKNEMIVPLSMRPLQKQVYKSIMEKNADLMEALARATRKDGLTGKPAKVKAVHNMLMQLRKCAQHPYLNNPGLEDLNASAAAQQQSLIDASAKLAFLRTLLPRLKAQGHRVLIFSQFVIALDLLQDFLDGAGYKFLRLDGSTPQAVRQKDIDKFNAPDSEYFVYMLSTRAGGVGINLASADTVIIADLDFNPHLDMQAIARAHRFGQRKKVMVFRLMMKRTVEETIMQIGKKKLMLDHLIVQTMQKDDEEDFSAILLNGARAIFEETDEQEVSYDADAVDKMVTELETREEVKEKTVGFTFAPIYDQKTNKLAELEEEVEDQAGAADFWKDVLERANADRAKAEQAAFGRGARRAAVSAVNGGIWDAADESGAGAKSKGESRGESPASDYAMSDGGGESDGAEDLAGADAADDLSGLGPGGDSGGIVAISKGRKRLKVAQGQAANGTLGLLPANGKPKRGRAPAGSAAAGIAIDPSQLHARGPATTLAELAPTLERYPLLQSENEHLWTSLGKVQVLREEGAFLHAAHALLAILREVSERIQIKGHATLVPKAFDQSIPPRTRAKTYKQMCHRVDRVLELSGAQPMFATREGLAIAVYLFSETGELLYSIPRGGPSPAAQQAPPRHQRPRDPSPEVAYRTLGLANGLSGAAIAIDDDNDEVQDSCSLCRGPHMVERCGRLDSVEGIDMSIAQIKSGFDSDHDKRFTINWLAHRRAEVLRERERLVMSRPIAPNPSARNPAPAVKHRRIAPFPHVVPPTVPATVDGAPRPECAICGGPPHSVQQCPTMIAGGTDMLRAYQRLAGTPYANEMKVIVDKQLVMGSMLGLMPSSSKRK